MKTQDGRNSSCMNTGSESINIKNLFLYELLHQSVIGLKTGGEIN